MSLFLRWLGTSQFCSPHPQSPLRLGKGTWIGLPLLWLLLTFAAQAQPVPPVAPPDNPLDLPSDGMDNSPVLRRWQENVPDVLSEIRNDPAFRSRIRLGYTEFPSTDEAAGFVVGVEDVIVGRSHLTISGEYQRTFEGDRQSYGGDLRYYVLPMGSQINVAPLVGYRRLETDGYQSDGIQVGVRLMLVLSRTGAADVSVTQSWVAPGTNEEVGMTAISAGYALTQQLRLSTDIRRQNSTGGKDTQFGVLLEWML